MSIIILLLMAVSTFMGAVAGLYLKKGSATFSLHPLRLLRNTNFIIGGVLYVLGVVLYLFVLRALPLSVAYPLSSLQYVWITFLSLFILRENVDAWRWGGIALIMAGIVILTV